MTASKHAAFASDLFYEAEISALKEENAQLKAEVLRLRAHIEILMEKKARDKSKEAKPFDREKLMLLFVDKDTSMRAAGLAEGFRLSMIHEIWLHLIEKGPATCQEIETAMRAKHQTVSARLRDLQDLGYVADTGERRATSMHGKGMSIVWKAVGSRP